MSYKNKQRRHDGAAGNAEASAKTGTAAQDSRMKKQVSTVSQASANSTTNRFAAFGQ